MIKVGILGGSGRMGRAIINEIINGNSSVELAGATTSTNSNMIGTDLGTMVAAKNIGIIMTDYTQGLFNICDVLIDVSTKAALDNHLKLAIKNQRPLIIGATGLGPEHDAMILAASNQTAIIKAANFSKGINLLLQLAQIAAAKLDDDFDIEIVEMHHRYKVDAPSGTALAIGQAAMQGRNISNAAVNITASGKRKSGAIGYAVVRGGDMTGEHKIIFAGDGERIEIGHISSSRAALARGAIAAAIWLNTKSAGLYSMGDVYSGI